MPSDLVLTTSRASEDVVAARALRHRVFVHEMGASPGLDGLEGDAFDADCDHLLLRDRTRPEADVVATLRIGIGAAYTAREFDLSRVMATGRIVAEAGRACLNPDYRGGPAAVALFAGLLREMRRRGAEILVGTASFPGADADRHLPALRRLRQEALAPEAIRPRAVGPNAIDIAGPAPTGAMRGVPSLIKTYLRAGAHVGEGAYLDRGFNTVDVCMILDMDHVRMPAIADRVAGGHGR
ncbi:GNAT family N-acetyltransferase [Jannaschia sp. S6380]|uniref:GNAT family N-acetyltransferase n=1 Tax=Jannaschia sp. S6380 TaxID=2926408 RepID=UPI001FF2D49C|nr:GNAT family N-acetyltransferase [Jannaschia sp. S6380]MCK0166386.1 GNAT family N-acetyltransferase [Jannaschia sp. S6380]